VPIALLFPILLWIASRCRPVFAAAAAFIVTLAIVWTTTIGRSRSPHGRPRACCSRRHHGCGALCIRSRCALRRTAAARSYARRERNQLAGGADGRCSHDFCVGSRHGCVTAQRQRPAHPGV
jgi:hypothetical protein